MSDEPDKSEKSEDPSQRKLEEAHKRGEVAKSHEVTTWFMTLGSALLFAIMAPVTSVQLADRLTPIFSHAGQTDLSGPGFQSFVTDLALRIFSVALLPLVFMAICAAAGNIVQHAPLFSFDPIKPKWSRVSPLAGAKRLFSSEALVNFVKGLIKISVVAIAIFSVLWPEQARLDTLITADLDTVLFVFLELAQQVFGVVVSIVTVIAIADYMYQRFKWWERQKMTLKEVKDEYKQMEGDPQVKQRIRQIRADKARRRMMQAVPDATVVVTNPTHYAIALKYDRGMPAPICVAKGADAVALRIRKLAGENNVPIVENPPLARALFASVDIDGTVPTEHFKAVAQVIGYVMRLNEKTSWRK